MSSTPTLEFRDLEVAYTVRGIDREVLRKVSFSIAPGEAYGLVGESGCGKSTGAFAAMRYLPRNGKITGGSILFEGQDIVGMSPQDINTLRRSAISMVYQNPATALNPTIRIGDQVAEVFALQGLSKSDAYAQVEQALIKVQIADPTKVMRRYAHQLSGGMAQRVVIAMALASNPRLLVMDEPTTGLDATVEAEVLDLVRKLRKESGTAVLFISHNLGVIRHMCDRVGVLYAGALVEQGATEDIFSNPSHPYTVGLLRCIPRGGLHKNTNRLDTIPGTPPALGTHFDGCVFADRCALVEDKCRTTQPEMVTVGQSHVARCFHTDKAGSMPHAIDTVTVSVSQNPNRATTGTRLLDIDHLSKAFTQDGHAVHVVNDVSLQVGVGETLGLVGESGAGKTTIIDVLLGVLHPDEGKVSISGLSPMLAVAKWPGAVSYVPQDVAIAAGTIRENVALGYPLELATDDLVMRALKVAHLDKFIEELPFGIDTQVGERGAKLSGGQRQRLGIARAMFTQPHLLVLDEATSSLDGETEANITDAIHDLRGKTTVVMIAHRLSTIRNADIVIYLSKGTVMAVGAFDQVRNAVPDFDHQAKLMGL